MPTYILKTDISPLLSLVSCTYEMMENASGNKGKILYL